MLDSGQNWWVFVQRDLENWWMTLKNNRAPLLCYFKFCASFRSHWWIQTGVTARKRPIWVKIDDFFSRVTLKSDGWPWKINRAPLLSNIKLCAPFHCHIQIQTGNSPETAKFGFDLCHLDLCHFWPWPFAWISLLSLVIISWWYDDGNIVKKSVKGGQTDRRTDPFIELLGRS